jgi:putative nuclease YbcO-like protein
MVCNGDPSTTVLCHYRLAGISGMGMKSPDEIAAYACSACHDAIDRRSHTDLDRDYVKLAHAEGVFRTWVDREADAEQEANFVFGRSMGHSAR